MITLRPIQLPHDRTALLHLATAFETDQIYQIAATPTSFTLVETPVDPPIRKSFPLEDELGDDRLWEEGFVAEAGTTLVGFVALRHEVWSRRTAIWHLYVDPTQRRMGLGRRLITTAIAAARNQNARCLWLEVTNVNAPAIMFYRRIGFRFCGLDQSLYDPAGDAAGETALYFALDLL